MLIMSKIVVVVGPTCTAVQQFLLISLAWFIGVANCEGIIPMSCLLSMKC